MGYLSSDAFVINVPKLHRSKAGKNEQWFHYALHLSSQIPGSTFDFTHQN